MKKFECNWGDWDEDAIISYAPQRKVVNEDFFGEMPNEDLSNANSMGYEYEDMVNIQNLQLSETWHCPLGNHTVTRIH